MVLDFLVQRVGLWGIFAFLALTGVGVPIPEEAPLVLAGVLSKSGRFDPMQALAFCLAGALVGDSIMYAIGRRLGHAFLLKHPLISRFVNAEEEEKLEHVIQKHGFKILLGTRFLIGIRGAVYFAAGAARVPYLRFLMWDLVAASLVVLIVFGLGYLFGPWIEPVIGDAEKLVTVIVVAVLIGVGYMLYRKRVERIDREIERLERESQNEKLAEGAAPQPKADDESDADKQSDAAAQDRSA